MDTGYIIGSVIVLVVLYGGFGVWAFLFNKNKKRAAQIYSITEKDTDDTIPLRNFTCAFQEDDIKVFKYISWTINRANQPAGGYPLLKGAYIDYGKQCLVLANGIREKITYKKNKKHLGFINQKELKCQSGKNAIVCNHCGATNKIQPNGKNECEYCGSPLKI